ncbi:MAG: ABC transporter substrate-binding protein [Beijerinckiaceae bacterium]|nr:ABC transporter substrate-binding protein [Beijerinckiaceae bacterium]
MRGAQAADGERQVAIALSIPATDPDTKSRVSAVQRQMAQLGWLEGRTVRYEIFYADGSAEMAHANAAKIVAGKAEVVLTSGTLATAAMRGATKTIPIVFTNVTDPVAGGFVESLSRPGGNITGFTPFEYPIAGKWLQRLLEIAPGITRVALLGEAANHNFKGFWVAFEPIARQRGVQPLQTSGATASDIDGNLRTLAEQPGGGLVITASQYSLTHRERIIRLADQMKLPAVYWSRSFAEAGGLISYGPNIEKLHAQAATYLDRILRGARPDALPVQEAIDFETVVNLRAARALGLTVPVSLLAQADEVIE